LAVFYAARVQVCAGRDSNQKVPDDFVTVGWRESLLVLIRILIFI
jgi:hypothetical protein